MPITKSLAAILFIGLTSVQTQPAFSQSGDTKAELCHTNPNSGYHCHNPKAEVPERVTYCHVVNGEDHCGFVFDACVVMVTQYGGACRQQSETDFAEDRRPRVSPEPALPRA